MAGFLPTGVLAVVIGKRPFRVHCYLFIVGYCGTQGERPFPKLPTHHVYIPASISGSVSNRTPCCAANECAASVNACRANRV
jgi:hypothetical protein